jgi:predicted CopG family antitoxin
MDSLNRNKQITTISVSKETKLELEKLGRMAQTKDDLIRELIKLRKEKDLQAKEKSIEVRKEG